MMWMRNPILFLLALLMVEPAVAGEMRIISSAPNFTEMLFALDLGGKVVGVTDFCRFPPEAALKEKIGGYLNPNLEKIIRLRPTLVITPRTKSDLPQKLRRLNIPTLEIPNETVNDALNAITSIAGAASVPERGAQLRTTIAHDLESLKIKYAQKPPVRTLIVVGRAPDSLRDIYAAGPGTFLDELLRFGGGENILPPQTALYPKLSRESLIALNTDVILDTTFSGLAPTTDTLNAALRPWLDFTSVNAVKNGRVYIILDPSLTIQGPRLAHSAHLIADYLHPPALKLRRAYPP